MFGILPQRNLNEPKSKKQPTKTANNPVEAIKDIGSGIVKSTATDLIGGIAKDSINIIFGKKPQVLEPNQTIDLSKLNSEASVETYFKPFQNPLERKNSILTTRAEIEITKEIEEVRTELKMLIKAAKELSHEAEKSITERPVSPGVYHLNFFERLKLILKVARQQIEDSSTWLAAMSSKKAQKGYWAMFKKHGTSFGMSNERSTATSMG